MRNQTHETAGTPADAASGGIGKCAVVCPMCKLEHTQYRLNPRMYWPTDMDVDRKPSGFRCLQGLDGYYPPLYELWHCPRCHYTAHNRVFPDPLKDYFIERGIVQRQWLDLSTTHAGKARIANSLGAGIVFDQTDFDQAIRMALLAVYFEIFIFDMLKQNPVALARAYLRVAWLYRDLNAMDRPDREDCQKRLAAGLETVVADWPDIPRDEPGALRKACEWFDQALVVPAIADHAGGAASIQLHAARLRLQLVEYEDARRYLNDARQTASDELQRINRLLQDDDHRKQFSADERGGYVSESRKLRTLLDEGESLQSVIGDALSAQDHRRARTLIAEHRGASRDVLQAHLTRAGIGSKVIAELLPEPKRGLFGGLFK